MGFAAETSCGFQERLVQTQLFQQPDQGRPYEDQGPAKSDDLWLPFENYVVDAGRVECMARDEPGRPAAEDNNAKVRCVRHIWRREVGRAEMGWKC